MSEDCHENTIVNGVWPDGKQRVTTNVYVCRVCENGYICWGYQDRLFSRDEADAHCPYCHPGLLDDCGNRFDPLKKD